MQSVMLSVALLLSAAPAIAEDVKPDAAPPTISELKQTVDALIADAKSRDTMLDDARQRIARLELVNNQLYVEVGILRHLVPVLYGNKFAGPGGADKNASTMQFCKSHGFQAAVLALPAQGVNNFAFLCATQADQRWIAPPPNQH